jgi:hypothetical protein
VYIPPSEEDGSTIELIQAAVMKEAELPLILLGDLNVDIKMEIKKMENIPQMETLTMI